MLKMGGGKNSFVVVLFAAHLSFSHAEGGRKTFPPVSTKRGGGWRHKQFYPF